MSQIVGKKIGGEESILLNEEKNDSPIRPKNLLHEFQGKKSLSLNKTKGFLIQKENKEANANKQTEKKSKPITKPLKKKAEKELIIQKLNENPQHDNLLKKKSILKNEKKPYKELLNEKEKIKVLKEKKIEIIKRIDDQISKDVILFDRPPEKEAHQIKEEARDQKFRQSDSFEKEYKQLNMLLIKNKMSPENHLLYLDELLKTKIENKESKLKEENSNDSIKEDDKIEADITTFKNLFNKNPHHSFEESQIVLKPRNLFENNCKNAKTDSSNYEIKRSEFFDDDMDDFYAILNEDLNNLMNKDKLFLK